MTPLAAATATDTLPVGWLALAALVWLLAYLLACAVWPFTACGWCQGGKKRSPSGRAWRPCGRCGGKGSKLRLGRRVWGRLRSEADKRR